MESGGLTGFGGYRGWVSRCLAGFSATGVSGRPGGSGVSLGFGM